MGHETVERDGMTLIGLEIRTSNENAHEIGAVWGRFMGGNLADAIPDRIGGNLIAVYCEYEGDHTKPYTFFLGCPVTPGAEAPEGMTTRTVPGGSFARFLAEGDMPGALMETWGAIWNAPITRSFEVDYEVHDPAMPTRAEVLIGTTGGGVDTRDQASDAQRLDMSTSAASVAS